MYVYPVHETPNLDWNLGWSKLENGKRGLKKGSVFAPFADENRLVDCFSHIGAQLVMIVQNTEYRIVGLDHQDTPLTL